KIVTLIEHHTRMIDKNNIETNVRFAKAFDLTICKFPETLYNNDENIIQDHDNIINKCKRFYKKLIDEKDDICVECTKHILMNKSKNNQINIDCCNNLSERDKRFIFNTYLDMNLPSDKEILNVRNITYKKIPSSIQFEFLKLQNRILHLIKIANNINNTN